MQPALLPWIPNTIPKEQRQEVEVGSKQQFLYHGVLPTCVESAPIKESGFSSASKRPYPQSTSGQIWVCVFRKLLYCLWILQYIGTVNDTFHDFSLCYSQITEVRRSRHLRNRVAVTGHRESTAFSPSSLPIEARCLLIFISFNAPSAQKDSPRTAHCNFTTD